MAKKTVSILMAWAMTWAWSMDIVLIDFGRDATGNTYEHQGWQTPIMDIYTDYVNIGPGGTSITAGANGTYNYQGIQGLPLLFSSSYSIRVTWFNGTNDSMTFTPNISFNDPDRIGSGANGNWYAMSQVTIAANDTAETVFQLDGQSQGVYSLVNVNCNYDNESGLICDKITLTGVAPDVEPPTVPQNLIANPQSPYEMSLLWDSSSDNISVMGYKIFRDNTLIATVLSNSYTDQNLSPARYYQYKVSAYDLVGNESLMSAPILGYTLDGPVLVNSFASFNNQTGNHRDGFDNWHYANTLGTSGDAGGFYSDPDQTNHVQQFVPYYNGYNSNHMGWLRWGYADINFQFSTSGSGSLEFVMTGGAYDDNGVVAYSGLPVTHKEQFESYLANGDDPYSNVDLPGGVSFYALSSETSSIHTFEALQGVDRLSMWVFLPEEVTHVGASRPNTTINYYPFIDDGAGGHYYHYVTNVALGGWTHVIFDAHPLHANSGDPYIYSQYRAGGLECPGQAIEYFNRTARFSIVINGPLPYSPSSIFIDEIETYKVPQYENDETIANIGVGYDPVNKDFDIGFCDKYRGAVCEAFYELRYSFSPITNANYDLAKLATIIQDPDVSFFYTTGNQGEIQKPNKGYSQIWARFSLDPEDRDQLTLGTHIYFAVKDISTRTFPDRDPYDEESILIPGLGITRRIDLVKTIDYTIHRGPRACITQMMAQYPFWNQTINILDLTAGACP